MTDALRQRLLELAIQSGASASIAIARADEFERYIKCPSSVALSEPLEASPASAVCSASA